MPFTSNDDQVRFLISCIRNSNSGKINFVQVARECNIVSKGAAAKRYERMLRVHNILPPQPPPPFVSANPVPRSAAVPKPRNTTVSTPRNATVSVPRSTYAPKPKNRSKQSDFCTAQKRKIAAFTDEDRHVDDEEDFPNAAPAPKKFWGESIGRGEAGMKSSGAKLMSISEARDLVRYYRDGQQDELVPRCEVNVDDGEFERNGFRILE